MVDLIAAENGSEDPDVVAARRRAANVIANHHNLLLGLQDHAPTRAGRADFTATDSSRLRALNDQ